MPSTSASLRRSAAAGVACALTLAAYRANDRAAAPARDSAAAAAAGAATAGATSGATSGAPLVYVSNEDGNSISVIDAATDSVVGTIFVGKRPRGIAVSADGRTVYAAVSGSPKAPPGVDERTLPARPRRRRDRRGRRPVAPRDQGARERPRPGGPFAVTPDGRRAYVSNEDAATASVVDVASGRVVKAIPVGGELEGVTLSPDGRFVYVTSEEEHAVYVVDAGADSVVAKIPTGKRPRAVAFTPDGRKAYVSAELGGAVEVVDAVRHRRVRTVPIPGPGARPMGVAVAPDGRTAYVTTGRGGVVGTVRAGAVPGGVAVRRRE